MDNNYKTEIEEIPCTALISCVGQRPLAVINPINTLIDRIGRRDRKITVTLLTTDVTEAKGRECKEWFIQKYPDIIINCMPFRQDNLNETIENITKRCSSIYFNANPGMNWEISTLATNLPDNTRYIYADFARLFVWQSEEDISNAKSIKLLDVGLELYNRFSDKKFQEFEGIKRGISDNLKILLEKHGLNKSYSVYGKNIPENSEIADFINERLVWVREKSGYIYLLFDFHLEETLNINDIAETKKLNKYYLDMYRAITKIFDPINFTLTITTDSQHIKKRAEIDGICAIFYDHKSHNKWESYIMTWLKSTTAISPKKIINERLEQQKTAARPEKEKGISKDESLVVCLGDNIDTTLTAIYSHGLKNVFLFYDEKSPRIAFFAKKIRANLKNFKINLLPTNNLGSGIMNHIVNLFKGGLNRIDINVTPGTKSQSIALVQSAKKIGRTNSLYSIDKNSIKRLTDPSFSSSVKTPEIDVIINCHMAHFRGSTSVPNVPAFLSVMEGIAQGTIIPHQSILDLHNNQGEKIFKIISSSPTMNRFFCLLDRKTYNLDNSFLDPLKTGIWWEAVVAYTLKTMLQRDIIWEAVWDWAEMKSKRNKSHFTEIDVVFRFKNSICAISCKAGQRGLKDTATYEIKSEAEKRFGRFALPFVAIPFDYYNGKNYAGIIENDIMYLTPSLMLDSENLKNEIENFAISKSTYSSIN